MVGCLFKLHFELYTAQLMPCDPPAKGKSFVLRPYLTIVVYYEKKIMHLFPRSLSTLLFPSNVANDFERDNEVHLK